MARERVAKVSDVPEGRGLRVEVGGHEIGLFRVGDSFYAIENACPHAGFPLSEGLLEGHKVICTAHGWEFDVRTGSSADALVAEPLGCYRVSVEDDEIWIEVPGAAS